MYRAICLDTVNNYLCEVIYNMYSVGGIKNIFFKTSHKKDEIGGGIYKVKKIIKIIIKIYC